MSSKQRSRSGDPTEVQKPKLDENGKVIPPAPGDEVDEDVQPAAGGT